MRFDSISNLSKKYLALMSNITGHCMLLLINYNRLKKNREAKHIQDIKYITVRYNRENEEIL